MRGIVQARAAASPARDFCVVTSRGLGLFQVNALLPSPKTSQKTMSIIIISRHEGRVYCLFRRSIKRQYAHVSDAFALPSYAYGTIPVVSQDWKLCSSAVYMHQIVPQRY